MMEGENTIKPALHFVMKDVDDIACTFTTGIPLSDSTKTRWVEMQEDMSEQLIQSQKDAVFSIALDESTDAINTAQLPKFRSVVDQELDVKKKVLGFVAMEE